MNNANHNDDYASPQKELQQFEQQLRSLTPRAASFQIAAHEYATASANPAVQPAKPARGHTSYALTLLATWAGGAAAGVLVTLSLQNPSSEEKPMVATEHRPASELLAQSRDSDNLAPSFSAAPDRVQNPPRDTQVASTNPFAIATGPWQSRVQPDSAASSLTVFNRSLVLSELDGRFMQFGNPRSEVSPQSTRQTSKTNRNQSEDGVEKRTPIVPVKINMPPPASQRDMLRDLLDTYGAIH